MSTPWIDSVTFTRCCLCMKVGDPRFYCEPCKQNSANIETLKRTLAQPHMVWAAEQHSVGIDIVKEDQRLRERLKALADLEATMVSTGR